MNQTRLLSVICKIQNPCLSTVCRELVNEGPYSRFGMWPASMSYHHAYPGGLLAHTLEVCEIATALMNSNSVHSMNRDVVLAACVWHDYGKVDEYVLKVGDASTARSRTIKAVSTSYWTKSPDIPDKSHPHIEWSADAFVRAVNAAGRSVNDETVEHVADCILSHHGRVEWGSPFEPKTAEAILVHQADMLSAKIGASRKQ